MPGRIEPGSGGELREARNRFPATDGMAYFNTAAVGLASRALTATLHEEVDAWARTGFDYSR